MKLAIYDTFERKVTLTETLIWLAIFVVGLIPFLHLLGIVGVTLYDYFFPIPLIPSSPFNRLPYD